jgi:hypothetical protein
MEKKSKKKKNRKKIGSELKKEDRKVSSMYNNKNHEQLLKFSYRSMLVDDIIRIDNVASALGHLFTISS